MTVAVAKNAVAKNAVAKTKAIWNDESGAILSTEFILVFTVITLGLVIGWSAIRDAVVTELGDVGQAVASLNQSYSFSGVTGHHANTPGSTFRDLLDTCDDVCAQPQGANSRCILICSIPAQHEGANAVVTLPVGGIFP